MRNIPSRRKREIVYLPVQKRVVSKVVGCSWTIAETRLMTNRLNGMLFCNVSLVADKLVKRGNEKKKK